MNTTPKRVEESRLSRPASQAPLSRVAHLLPRPSQVKLQLGQRRHKLLHLPLPLPLLLLAMLLTGHTEKCNQLLEMFSFYSYSTRSDSFLLVCHVGYYNCTLYNISYFLIFHFYRNLFIYSLLTFLKISIWTEISRNLDQCT